MLSRLLLRWKTLMQTTKKAPWSRGIAWVLASLSLAVLLVKYAQPISSPDLWWHMAFGREILRTGNPIIDHSIFTWTPANPVFIYNAWLSEILLFRVYEWFGPWGLIALRYLVYLAFLGLGVLYARRRGILSHPLSWVILSVGLGLAVIAQLVKPELFSFFFMTLTVWLYFQIRSLGHRGWALCYLFPVILVLWLNSHGAFSLAAPFFLALGAGELLNRWFSPQQAMPVRVEVHFFIALALCLPVLLLNPFGDELPRYLLGHLLEGYPELSSYAQQIGAYRSTATFQNPPFYMLDHMLFAMVLFVFLLWQKLRVRQTDWAVILAFLTYVWLYTQFIRTAYFLAPVFVFTTLDLLAHRSPSWFWSKTAVGRWIISLFSLTIAGVIAWRTLDASCCYLNTKSLLHGEAIAADVPVEEADFIEKLPGIHRVGNLYGSGGYLLYRLWPKMQITIDGRYKPFVSWIDTYVAFIKGQHIPEFLRSHPADLWLIEHEQQILMRYFLRAENWQPLFMGTAGIVFGPKDRFAKTALKISPNFSATRERNALIHIFNTVIALKDWSRAEKLLSAMDQTECGTLCKKRTQDIHREMEGILKGYQAFLTGDYKTAAQFLPQAGPAFAMQSITMQALMLAMDQAWKAKDYAQARDYALNAVRFCEKSAACLYNVAAADWQYQHALPPQQREDKLWKLFSDLFLEKVPEGKENIAPFRVILDMKAGTLTRVPFLLVPQLPKESSP